MGMGAGGLTIPNMEFPLFSKDVPTFCIFRSLLYSLPCVVSQGLGDLWLIHQTKPSSCPKAGKRWELFMHSLRRCLCFQPHAFSQPSEAPALLVVSLSRFWGVNGLDPPLNLFVVSIETHRPDVPFLIDVLISLPLG